MLLEHCEMLFRHVVSWGILILEFFGVTVLIVTAVLSMIKWLRRAPDVRSTIAQGILLGLAFKMGGEVLRTVIIEEPKEMFIIFGIILLRGIVAGLIYWEIGKEAKLEALYREVRPPKEQPQEAERETIGNT